MREWVRIHYQMHRVVQVDDDVYYDHDDCPMFTTTTSFNFNQLPGSINHRAKTRMMTTGNNTMIMIVVGSTETSAGLPRRRAQ